MQQCFVADKCYMVDKCYMGSIVCQVSVPKLFYGKFCVHCRSQLFWFTVIPSHLKVSYLVYCTNSLPGYLRSAAWCSTSGKKNPHNMTNNVTNKLGLSDG